MRDNAQQVDDLIANSNHISKWVEEQPTESQARLFNFYIEWNESDNHRSMRLVLDLLPRLIKRNPDEEVSQSTKGSILDNLISIVTGMSAKPLAKSAIKALDHLLTKDVVSVEEIYSSYVTLHQKEMSDDKLEVWKAFFFELFHWMRLHFVCPVAGRFIVVLYRALRRQTSDKPADLTIEIWHQWLLEALAEESSILEPVKNYIFLSLFKADKSEALLFLRRMNNYETVSASTGLDLDIPALLQLAALETGKKVGGDGKPNGEESSIVLDEKVLESVLAHPSHEVRSFAFSLLVSSPLTTRPYSSKALDLLRKHMVAFFAESDAKFRNDISSKARDMFKRVRGAIFVLKRSIPRAVVQAQKDNEAQGTSASKPNTVIYRANLISLPEAQLVEYLDYHEKFLFWYIGFLCSELTPTASYQRHIASLKAVKFMLRMEGEQSKTWETSDDQRLFFDRFDGTWLRALSDLVMDPFDDVREHSASVLRQIFSDKRHQGFTLMSTGGKINASEELAELLRRAEKLARRTARADHSDGVARACQLLYRFSDGEQNRLSLLATLIGGLETKLSVAEKDLGRAVLEAPVHGDFSSLCYTWQVVSELQFSESELQSVQSLQDRLVICIERVWVAVRDILCDDSPEGHLPQDLEEVDGLDTKDILSYSFRAVHEASFEARASETDGTNLPQVHAYNCLKDIFKSSYLTAVGNKSEKYLLQCLELAANGLKSELWAIRNCGLILLRSLIDCLFGSHESKATMEAGWDGKANRIAYHRYTSLPNVLLNLLKSGHEIAAPTAMGSAAAESVFPALDIIRRAGPPELLRDELQIHIAKYLASPVWHVREIAARTLCSCLLHDKWLDVIATLAAESVQSTDGNTQNHVHGVLLSLRYVIERLQEVMQDRLQEIAAAYLEVVNMVRALPMSDAAGRVQFKFPTFGMSESALLKTQRAIHEVYSASESENPVESLRNLLLGKHMGVNSLVAGLEMIPKLWDVSKFSDIDLSNFCDLYLDVCLAIRPAEPRVVALENLTDLLYHSLKTNNAAALSTSSLSLVWSSLHSGMLNPGLSNAIIRISGCIMAILRQRQGISATGLQNWGHMMSDAGLDDKDFDTRLSAAESLSSFFSVTDSAWTVEECLPALLAVYDSLNDDDGDIRDIGSAAVKSILGQPLVPIEAANRLVAWLAQHFGDSSTFRQIVAGRIMGDTRFPRVDNGDAKFPDQLKEAMKFDDSLFVIEEQNLFIDEARESQRWVAAFESMQWSPEDDALKHLTLTVYGGLVPMDSLTNEEDGPLGYGSKPQVFAILSRVIQAAAALTRHHPDLSQRASIKQASRVFESGKGHISGLLLQPLKEGTHV
ncbi:hypothetical protein G7Z17_g7765 [Cylindrodendrum hubeiense]|uniref:DUF2428 domain-containing protein n=1 Tax=Cylindrodendrum hubeiense TaxID=595255 RepID=A0A9P5LFF4_9HYPO|nr:hypothetical protein G7Z17_g7765 [Cylindrodendrum hubeiense]